MAVTLKEIAAKAGKSICTVSVVLNGSEGANVSAKTRQEILAAATALGYSGSGSLPHPATGNAPGKWRDEEVQRVRGGRPRAVRIGILAGHDQRPYGRLYNTMQAEAVRQALARYGFEAAFMLTEMELVGNEAMFRRVVRDLSGIISTHGAHTPSMERLVDSVPRFASLGGSILKDRVINVTVDYGALVRRALDHLVRLEHRRIGYILLSSSMSPRILAYKDYMASHFPGWRNEWLQMSGGENIVDCRQWVKDALDRVFTAPETPTALLAHDDEVAIETLRLLRKRGLRVPQDVALIGFDRTGFAAYTDPAMTVIEYPRERIAEVAVRMMIDQTQAGRFEPLSVLVPAEVVVRETCGTAVPE